jgi:hypothetical protein
MPEKQDRRIPEEVRTILPELIRKTGCGDWSVRGSPLQRRDCRIYFLESGSFRLPGLVLKIYLQDEVWEHLAKSLHKKSRRYMKAATAECAVPEPILLLPEANAMVMECVEAPSAGSLLMRGFHSVEIRREVVRKAARWLRWFHESKGVTSEPFEAASYTGPLAGSAEKIRQLAPERLAGDALLRKCIEAAGEFATSMDGLEFPHATAHGDFTPFNLFIHGERMVGFDFRANRRLPVPHDICRFLLYLDIYRITPAGGGELSRYGCRRDDFEIFMAEYGTGREWLEDGIWLKLQFMEITRRITSLSLPRTRLRKRLLRFIEIAYLRRNARHILAALK